MESKSCSECRWCLCEPTDKACIYTFGCEKVYSIDRVTGEKLYEPCENVRKVYPECYMWEQGGWKGFFQRLSKKIKETWK